MDKANIINNILVINGPARAGKALAQNTRDRRLALEWTQAELSLRSGVPIATLRRFEQKGEISLEGFLKLQMVLGNLEGVVAATEPGPQIYRSIDDVLADKSRPKRKRGRRK